MAKEKKEKPVINTAGKVCVINGTNNHTVTIKNNTGVQRNFRIMVYSAAFN